MATARKVLQASLGLMLVTCLGAAGSATPPLLWPLPIREGLTSGFGEFRRSHFHGGVDMRTHQEEGWPCFAPADGKVARIRREAGGYGRVLYLDLNDGRTIVYGHVCRFENKKLHLDDRLLRACERTGTSFPGDVPVDPPAPVKAGEVVCFSGELGIGTPHLHFEVRRGDLECDPFLEGLPLPEGMEAPRIAGITFEPQDAEATVEGGFLPVFVPAVRKPDGYALARPVRVHGAVDLFVQAADHLGISDHATGLPLLSASLDGEAFFRMDLKRISLAHYKESPALFEPSFDKPGTYSYRLRRLPWLNAEDVEGGGLPPALAPGEHRLAVTASNRAGLSAALTGTLRAEPSPPEVSDALPGTGFRIIEHRAVPAGLLLTLSRASATGQTPVSMGGHPLHALRVLGSGGTITVLVPREELPHVGAPVVIGGEASAFLAGAGRGSLTAGAVRLNLPEGAVGAASPASSDPGQPPGTAAHLAVAPYCLEGKATVEFVGIAPRPRVGVFCGGLFLDRWTGKSVGFHSGGRYTLHEDRTPPRFGKLTIVRIPHIEAPEVRFNLSDEDSGPSVQSLSVQLDGKRTFFDYDMANHSVRVDLSRSSPGAHTLSASVSDFLGNTAALGTQRFALR